MDRVREEETDKGSRMRRTVRVRDGQKSYEVMDKVKKYDSEKERELSGERGRERLCVCIFKH